MPRREQASIRSAAAPPRTPAAAARPVTAGKWLLLPRSIPGPSPEDRTRLIEFRLPVADVSKALRAGRRQPLMQLWSVVIGEPPPVPNVENWSGNVPARDGLTNLSAAHACFRGIERPLAEDNFGEDVYVFVLKPEAYYAYEPHKACVAHKERVAAGLVFVVYARLDQHGGNGAAQINGGAITHWHFVEADAADPALPRDHGTRYRKRCW